MNTIWTILLLISLLFLLFTSPQSLLSATIDGANDALQTSATLLTVYCFWNGFFALLEQSEATTLLAKVFTPLVKRLFGTLSPKATAYLTLNMSANLLGVSNASTPSAIKAIELMEGDNTRLSRQGAMLFVLNATSIQLFPTTVVGLRASYGSTAPTDIVLPTIIATFTTTILGILLVNLAYGRAQK